MPRKIIDLYDEQMLELQAQEQLVAMQVSDFPHITKDGRDKIRRGLIRMAGFDQAPAIDPTTTRDQKALGGIGIRVVKE